MTERFPLAPLRGAYCTACMVVLGVSLGGNLRGIRAADPERIANSSSGNDWPQWRGDGGRGALKDATLPDPWPTGPLRKTWQTRLGAGWSSPVVAQGRVFVTDRNGATERVLAFDANTGKPLWAKSHEVDFDPHPVGRRHGNGPKATPLVCEGKVYTVGIAGQLDCLRAADGETQWSVNYPKQFGQRKPLAGGRTRVNGTENVIVPIGDGQGAPVPLFGYTGSPTIAGKLLITPVGGPRGGTIMAFDKDTGQVIWKSLTENVSYSSPIVAEISGIEQVVVMTGPRVVGLAARDGASCGAIRSRFNTTNASALLRSPAIWCSSPPRADR